MSDRNGLVAGGIDIASVDNGNWQLTRTYDQAPYGIYSATVTAKDAVGNEATTVSTFKLDGLPPYADVTSAQTYVAANAAATIAGVASDIPLPTDGRTLHLHFESDGVWKDSSDNNLTMVCAACPTTGVAGQRGCHV